MKEEKIQTLHPTEGKTGKNISLAKYELVKNALLQIVKKNECTHLELMEGIHEKLVGKMEGNAQWYSETVKLDLEARKIIERTNTKPVRYRLV
jgi:hypothetical protein